MKPKKKLLQSLLIKPAGPSCNLSCEYCFYLEKKELFGNKPAYRMDDTILEILIKQALSQSKGNLSLAWQGGEPTMLGLDFFQKAINYQIRYGEGKEVSNALQTNGLLLNEKWADFLNKYHFLVGLSLDGPQHIHDKYRKTLNDGPSWEIVDSRARMLLNKGVLVNTLSCVTSYSYQFAEEIYEYHKNLGMEFMQFIPIVEPDRNDPDRAADFSVTAEQYGEFLVKIWDLWRADFVDGQPTTSVRQFESVFFTYVGLDAPECTLMEQCGPYVVVEHNGNVYSCDFFVEPRWKLGNIKYDLLTDMLNSKRQQNFGMIKSRLSEECRKCPWLQHCFGGCPKDRIKDPEDEELNAFCKDIGIPTDENGNAGDGEDRRDW